MIIFRLIAQYDSRISHVTYVYLALSYEGDAGGRTSRGWQSGRGSWPFVCSENNGNSRDTLCDPIQSKLPAFKADAAVKLYARATVPPQSKFATSGRRETPSSSNSNFQVSFEELHNLNSNLVRPSRGDGDGDGGGNTRDDDRNSRRGPRSLRGTAVRCRRRQILKFARKREGNRRARERAAHRKNRISVPSSRHIA